MCKPCIHNNLRFDLYYLPSTRVKGLTPTFSRHRPVAEHSHLASTCWVSGGEAMPQSKTLYKLWSFCEQQTKSHSGTRPRRLQPIITISALAHSGQVRQTVVTTSSLLGGKTSAKPSLLLHRSLPTVCRLATCTCIHVFPSIQQTHTFEAHTPHHTTPRHLNAAAAAAAARHKLG